MNHLTENKATSRARLDALLEHSYLLEIDWAQVDKNQSKVVAQD